MTVLPESAPVSGGNTGGFTLVEVVVALTILSLIMLATVTGLRTLANTQASLDRVTARIDEVRTVSSFLRDLMETAAVGEGGGGGGLSFGGGGRARDSAYFEMTDEWLAWKATVLFGEVYGGSCLVRVARENDLLVLRWLDSSVPRNSVDWSRAEKRALVVGLQQFDIAWRERPDQPWQRNWQVGDRVRWVRLQIKSADRFWPELILQVPQ